MRPLARRRSAEAEAASSASRAASRAATSGGRGGQLGADPGGGADDLGVDGPQHLEDPVRVGAPLLTWVPSRHAGRGRERRRSGPTRAAAGVFGTGTSAAGLAAPAAPEVGEHHGLLGGAGQVGPAWLGGPVEPLALEGGQQHRPLGPGTALVLDGPGQRRAGPSCS